MPNKRLERTAHSILFRVVPSVISCEPPLKRSVRLFQQGLSQAKFVMITDQKALNRIRESWRTVRILEARISTSLGAGIFSLVPMATGFREVPESLLLLFAMSVLEDTLKQLRDEGAFSCSRSELRRLMDSSRGVLSWQDFAHVSQARDRRNAVAHRREFLSDGECAQYLTAIENELFSWSVLDHRIKGRFDISIKTND